MNSTILIPTLLAASAASLAAPTEPHGTRVCLAPPSAQIPGMSTDEASAGVRQVFTTYLTGPTIHVEPLEARLPSQTREEAKLKHCEFTLYAKAVQEKKSRSGGLLGHIAAGALHSGASEVAAHSSSTGTRVLASAAAGGAAGSYYFGYATTTSDKLSLTWRLESGDGRVLSEQVQARKAGADGEDLLTPLIEQAAEKVVALSSTQNHVQQDGREPGEKAGERDRNIDHQK